MKKFNIYDLVVFALSLILFFPAYSSGSSVVLKSLSLRNGIESQVSLNWPLKDENEIYSSKYYAEDKKFAKEAEVDLAQHLNEAAIAGFSPKTRKFFMLFYNTAEPQGCNKEYLIQRVKIRKVSYNKRGQIINDTDKYLVEVMKTTGKTIKRADRHIKKYSLNKAYKRSVFAELEIGCGRITNITPSNDWPFAQNKLYKLIQNYSVSEGLYNEVEFEFSEKYLFNFHFSQNGSSSVEWPDFIGN